MLRKSLVILALFGVACTKKPEVRRYTLHGKIVSVDAVNKTANITNEKIEGWMEPMTMEYPVLNAERLHAGDSITATVVVTDLNYKLEDIKSP